MGRLTALALLVGASALSQTLPTPTGTDSYTVIYTGRTLGNFRIPELQEQLEDNKPVPCPAVEKGSAAEHFEDRLKEVADSTTGTTVRVASGDNFAPYLLSRDLLDPQKLELHQKIYNVNQPDASYIDAYVHGRAQIPFDNVACFITAIGLDALVPGKHDFYFGPEHLRELARLLREKDGGPRMLASNLVLHTRRIDRNQPDAIAAEPETPKPTGTGLGPGGPVAALPKIPLPWMRAVRIKNAFDIVVTMLSGASSPGARTMLTTAEFADSESRSFREWLKTFPAAHAEPFKDKNGNLYTVRPTLARVCIVPGPLPHSLPACDAHAIALQPSLDNSFGPDVEYEISAGQPLLDPAMNYGLCMVSASANMWYCTPFTVRETFFEYPASAAQIKKDMAPWVLKPAQDGKLPVAIFGVVDPDLMKSVGRLNYTWLGVKDRKTYPEDDSYETVVQAAQAGEALKQVLGYCLQAPDCRTAHKVLLAQMSEQDAYGIVGQLQALKGLPAGDASFELIVAAADADRASGNRTVVRTKPTNLSGHDFNQPVVLVPGEHVPTPNPYFLRVRLQKATVTPRVVPPAAERASIAEERIIRNVVFSGEPNSVFQVNPFSLIPSSPKSSKSLIDWMKMRPALLQDTGLNRNQTDDQAAKSLELMALKVMRESCHADAAVLQHRDVFFSGDTMFSAPVDRAVFQGMMDAIFWKGDFIQCIQVTGDIIKAMLDLSRQLQEEEDNGLETDYSSGWALATLGLNEDAKDPATRLIGGAYIDTKKLYSIAITDYLANGDTGYPMLQKAQPAPADRWSQTKLQSLSEAISKQVLDGTLPGHLKATDFLDSALRPIPPAPPSIGLSDLANNLFHNRAGDIAQSNTLEGKTQQRMRWSIDLYKADGSFSLFAHHGSETELGQQFPGVTTVDLSSPNTQTISFDYMFRIQRFTERGSFYLESDLNYGHKANRTATNVFQRSDTADYYNHEFGYAPGLWPRRQNPSSLKLLIPVASRMQLWPPITQITPGAGEKGAKAVASQAPVNYTVSFRPGLRFDYGYPKPSDSTAAGGSSGGKGQTGQIQTGQIWNSFFETGYEVGRLFNGPSAYEFMPVPGASNLMVTCTVYQVSCIETAPTASPSTYPGYAIRVLGGRDHTQSGFYVDFRFDIPLPRRLGLSAVEFVTENRGDFYVFGSHGDSPVDARLYDDLKSSLNIPILRKLSLAPTFEWIVFRNKAGDPFARSMGGTANTYYAINTFVSLTYSFGWHSGLEWKKVLGFNNQAPPLSSLPTR